MTHNRTPSTARWFAHTALILVAGCATTSPPTLPRDTADGRIPYRLTVGDRIDVKFPYKPQLNESIPIRPDGCVSLQLIGDIQASGLTPPELARDINEAYADRIRNPNATVIVREFAPQQVYVGGEVNAPGSIVLRGPLTCLQAVMARGGAKRTANLRQVLLIRNSGRGIAAVHQLNLTRVMKGRQADMTLAPYDVLYVPMTPIAQVGEFVEQYINRLVPTALQFPYDLNTRVEIINQDTGPTR